MERSVLSIVAGFAAGIVLYSYVSFGVSGILFAVTLGALCALLYWYKKQLPLFLTALCLFGVALGMGRTYLVPTTLPVAYIPFVNQEITIEGTIVAPPDIREQTQRLTIRALEQGVETKLLVVAPRYPEVRYGDTISVTGMFVRPEPFATDNGRTFRYDRFLAKDGIFALVEDASISVSAPREGVVSHIRGFFSDLKERGLSALSVALPEPHASLAGGLILGGKQGLGESLLDDFIRSGLIHIVVLSGYNVMIVAEFVLRAFGGLSRKKAAILATLTIVAFVLAAGAGAASIRAGIMAAIALYGRATGRTYDAFRALLFAGVLMVLWNPLTLAFDPGFQLSFIATVGLIFGAPLVESRLGFIKSTFLRELVASTIAAQIAVLPLLLYQNGLFSVISLPANILVLPLVPLAMLASALAPIAGMVVPIAAPVLGLPAYALLSYIITVVETASNLPLAAFTVPAFPFWLVILAYAALIYVTASKKRFSGTFQFTFSKNAST